ncbi:hypothetical protein HKX48_001965 [Thoreauomyces humboldtii]|nr:hypothetical protein HKX48_001965 [Thoreauomyces humboldtii]
MAGTSRSAAVKRLMKELADLKQDPSNEFAAAPLEDNLFEWHFTLRGPPEGGFQGGRFHGRLIFPPDYPFKPPNISFMTPNGRFEIGKKICLSITGHHPEYWRPAWGVRLALTALISFLPTPGDGAIGALDHTEEERKAHALASRTWVCPTCGGRNEDALPDESEVPSERLVGDPELSFSTRDASTVSMKQEETSPSTTGDAEAADLDPTASNPDTRRSVLRELPVVDAPPIPVLTSPSNSQHPLPPSQPQALQPTETLPAAPVIPVPRSPVPAALAAAPPLAVPPPTQAPAPAPTPGASPVAAMRQSLRMVETALGVVLILLAVLVSRRYSHMDEYDDDDV